MTESSVTSFMPSVHSFHKFHTETLAENGKPFLIFFHVLKVSNEIREKCIRSSHLLNVLMNIILLLQAELSINKHLECLENLFYIVRKEGFPLLFRNAIGGTCSYLICLSIKWKSFSIAFRVCLDADCALANLEKTHVDHFPMPAETLDFPSERCLINGQHVKLFTTFIGFTFNLR